MLTPRPFRELLSKTFIIPPYQRGYRWDVEQVTALLNDLKAFHLQQKKHRVGKTPYYCLQPLTVVAGGDDRYEVVDGQQRLTTVLLLLHYLKTSIRAHIEVFELQLPSRPEQERFINTGAFANPEADYESNIDNFYVAKAYQTICQWFDAQKDHRLPGALLDYFTYTPEADDTLEPEVRVIWYEIDHQSALDSFRRLNYGKIPLSATELVKAILLQGAATSTDPAYTATGTSRRAMEWDIMEQTLQQPTLWGMLASPNTGSMSHMDLLLDFVCDSLNTINNYGFRRKTPAQLAADPDSRDFFNYNVVTTHIAKTNAVNPLADIWNRIRDTFNLIQSWHDDNIWYHLIGLYRILPRNERRKATDSEFVKSIYSKAIDPDGKPVNRTDFTRALKKAIADEIRVDNIFSLRYGIDDKAMIRILLAHNVHSAISQSSLEQARMAFHLFDKFNITSLEHIHPQNITMEANYEQFKKWFEDRSAQATALTNAEWNAVESDATRQLQRKTDLTEAIEFIQSRVETPKKYADEAYRDQLLAHTKTLDSIFGDLSEITENELHAIGNMALVDRDTNSALQNFYLDRKRQTLYERQDNGQTYIMPSTRQVFAKAYTASAPGDMRLWRREDRKAYGADIEKAYNYFTKPSDR